MKPITNCSMPQANHAQPLVATLENKRGISCQVGSIISFIDLFVLSPPPVALCPFVINKAVATTNCRNFFW
jgi:hypothetical protein